MSTRVFTGRPKLRAVPTPKPPAKVKIASLDSWGWGAFIFQLAITFGFLAFGLTHFSFASRQLGADTPSTAGYEQTTISVSGAIDWKNGVGTLKDQNSGKTYTLYNSDALKELWDSGVKTVSVKGVVGENDSFTVQNVSAP